MSFEYGIRMLRLHLIQITRQLLVMFAQFLLRNNLIQLVVFRLIRIPLTTEHKGHLFKYDRVLASIHDLCYKFLVIHLLSYSKSIWKLVLLFVNIKALLVRFMHFFSISSILTAAAEIATNSIIIPLVTELG